MRRGSGVLLHISSLPGPFGIGCFGEEAEMFARTLGSTGVKFWQVLPFTVPGIGHSPYLSISALAGNPLLIDPRQLRDIGLLTDADVIDSQVDSDPRKTDFVLCRTKKAELLKRAYSKMPESMMSKIQAFVAKHDWLDDFALFLVIRSLNNGSDWREWTDVLLRLHDPAALDVIRKTYWNEYWYFCFIQYIFSEQWDALAKKIKEFGVGVIGDIPIYVSPDSADVWAHRELFQIDEDLKLTKVSGVPPDYFSEVGQLWGNPLYNWPAHEKEDYRWWRKRLEEKFKQFDLVRIDHFRAFSSYWSVPAEEKTAVNGTWERGPGVRFFERISRDLHNPPIIAEDLGEVTADLLYFLESTGFPGMRVIQFGFDDDEDNSHRPHNYPRRSVAYTGTHDNDTLLGWFKSLPKSSAVRVLEYYGFKADSLSTGRITLFDLGKTIIANLWQSHAKLVIVPMQDLLGLGSEARMNIPGTPEGNWAVRLTEDDLTLLDTEWLKGLNRIYGR